MNRNAILLCLGVSVVLVACANADCVFTHCVPASGSCEDTHKYLNCLNAVAETCDIDALKDAIQQTVDAAKKTLESLNCSSAERMLPMAFLMTILALMANKVFGV